MDEFITVDLRRDAHAAVIGRFDADNLALAPDFHVTGTSNLFWQSNYKIDHAAKLELRLGEKIEAPITDIAGLRREFQCLGIPRKHPHRQSHVKAASFAAVSSVGHGTPAD